MRYLRMVSWPFSHIEALLCHCGQGQPVGPGVLVLLDQLPALVQHLPLAVVGHCAGQRSLGVVVRPGFHFLHAQQDAIAREDLMSREILAFSSRHPICPFPQTKNCGASPRNSASAQVDDLL